MKKRMGIFMTAAFAAAVLTACTQADSGNSSAGTGSNSNSAVSGSGTIASSGGNGEGTAEQAGGGSAGDTSLAGAGGTAEAGGEIPGAAAADDGMAFEGGVSVEDEEEQETEAFAPEENLSDEQLDALEEQTDQTADNEGWAGTYQNENDETLTVSMVDARTISFSFANAGISGSAALDGNQATYNGDDYHVVVFNYSGTDIKVSVLSEEDFDASESPMNGVYVRE